MGRFHEVFVNRHVVLPVIHVETLAQAMRNVAIAWTAQCDGVFIINHSIPYRELLDIHRRLVEAHPGRWIGVNCLDVPAAAIFAKVTPDVAGIWVDNAEIDERTAGQPQAEQIDKARLGTAWRGLYFGGVAFKYQRQVGELEAAAAAAARHMDVITTSGPGTGQKPETAKICAMKHGAGACPLAIASGMTPDNVVDYLPYADCFLVATGISRDFSNLDLKRTRSLVDAVRAYSL